MATLQKKKNNRLYWVLGGAAVLLIAGAVIKGGSKPTGIEVNIEKVQKRSIREKVEASGKIYPEQEVKISSDVSGEVVQLLVREGDSVRAGQLLARIDADVYTSSVERGNAAVSGSKAQAAQAQAAVQAAQSQAAQSQAAIEQIQAQLVNTRQIQARNEQLFKDGVISEAEIQQSRSTLLALEANLKSAQSQLRASESAVEQSRQSANAAGFNIRSSEASLKELNTSLRRTSIFAPASGIVSKLNIEKGERVLGTIQMSGTEIMRIANLNAMEVQVDVNENEVMRINIGDETDVDIDAYPGRVFKGRVTEIANTASNALTATGQASLSSDQVTNFVVKIRVEPDSYRDLMADGRKYPFRPGMSASVSIFTELADNVLSIPIQAVTTREDKKDIDKTAPEKTTETTTSSAEIVKTYIFATTAADTVRMIEVKTGIQDDEFIQILSGLKDGEEIVSGPYDAVARKLESGKAFTRKEKDSMKGKKDDEE